MKKINFYLTTIILFLLPTYLVRFTIFNIPTTFLEILIYVLFLLTIISTLINKKTFFNPIFKKLVAPIILFFLAGIIGCTITSFQKEALGQFKAIIFDPLIFFWALTQNINSNKDLKISIYSLILSGFYVSLYSIWQYFTGQITIDNRVIGIFGYSPNYLAFFLSPIFVISIFIFWNDRKESNLLNILKILLIIAMLIAILLSGSRGALLAIGGGIILTFFVKYILLAKLINFYRNILIVIIILISLIIGYQFAKPDFNSSGGNRITSSNNIRWEIYKVTVLEVLPSNWLLGIGINNYQNYFTNLTNGRVNFPEFISPNAYTPHNLFLQIWLQLGIIGLLAFFWILYTSFKNIIIKNIYSIALCASLIVILIQGLIDTPFWKNDLAIMFWSIIFSISFINTIKNDQKNI